MFSPPPSDWLLLCSDSNCDGQIENLFAQVTAVWRVLRGGGELRMGSMRPGQYFLLAVFFTNLLTLFRGSQVANYFEAEELLFRVTVREYFAMASADPV